MKTPLPKLAAPAKRALESKGIAFLEDLSKLTENDIFALHGMGKNAMNTLAQEMQKEGVKYAD